MSEILALTSCVAQSQGSMLLLLLSCGLYFSCSDVSGLRQEVALHQEGKKQLEHDLRAMKEELAKWVIQLDWAHCGHFFEDWWWMLERERERERNQVNVFKHVVYVHVSWSESFHVCVCVSQWQKVPDEWQARQAIPAILQVSSSKHNAKKITTRVRGPFHQSITAILTEEEKRRSSLLNLHMLQSTCFGT